MTNFVIWTVHQILLCGHYDEMSWVCITGSRNANFGQFSQKTWRKEITWEAYAQIEDNIEMELNEIEYQNLYWIKLALDIV
jgi:hypothetical protein